MAITQSAKEFAGKLSINLNRLEVLDDFLKRVIDENQHPAAAVTIIRGGVEIFHGVYGAQSPDGTPLQGDAIYPVMSVTKSVTATMIAMLQEDGLIDICDKLQEYFPDFAGEGKDEVRLWHLLTHTSGMHDGEIDEYAKAEALNLFGLKAPLHSKREDLLDFGELLRDKMGLPKAPRTWSAAEDALDILGRAAPLKAKPHTQFFYSSIGYSMLAQIIEKVSGESLDNFSRSKLFEPLGMFDSHFILPREKWTRVIKRPDVCKGHEYLNSDDCCTNASGGGGLKSTMRDLSRFGLMWLQGGTLGGVRILAPASVREFTANYSLDIPPALRRGGWLIKGGQALGWSVRLDNKDDLGTLRSAKAYDHAGSGGARLLIDPDCDLVVAMYLVDKDASYRNNGRVANIIYSALD